MSVSDYRNKILDRVEKHRSSVDHDLNSILNLANSNEKLSELVGVINDKDATPEQKTGALSTLNAVSIFSSAARRLQPEIVNALRGQIEATDIDLRHGAIATLAAMKDDIVQERLLEEVTSDKPENEKLVPTASALAMLGRDDKALPSSVLREIMIDPPSKESQIEAIRQMPSDPEACEDLISLMKDDSVPLEARVMIPEMVSEADPDAFLSAAEDMLNTSGADSKLAPWLVNGIANAAVQDANAATSAKELVKKLRKGAPKSFQSAASTLLDKDNASDD
ncbi:hypothetical protein [Sphingorhabdus sp. Alg239-R122]|uniref:hypothetical protein n=1 Tax=Sphingorhabdus sp. Alg239-R122 TaxID=2305989 RepID=UPI0019683265|nr:hypothetical protein [Sphingorhabdus sp. Alg239-R122]